MSKWVVHARAEFEARHALVRYRGQVEESHSHRWQVSVAVGADTLDDDGMAIDFHAVRELLTRAVAPLAGSDLNRHPRIAHPTPSAERLAEVIAETLQPHLAELGGRLLRVSVWEGPDNRVDLCLEP